MSNETAIPVLNLETLHIASGSHNDRSNGLCVMEAVAWLANEPHSDHPVCTCPVIASFLRSLNDKMDDENRQLLKSYIPKLINTKANQDIELKRLFILADFAIRRWAVDALRFAGLEDEANKLANLPLIDNPNAAATRAAYAAYAAADAAADAAYATARAAAADAAADAAYATARAARAATRAARAAARAAADAAADAAYAAYAAADAAADAAYATARAAAADAADYKYGPWQECLDMLIDCK